MRIHVLDPLVANQIAAGEVIERPASIVKELLENSLDAGATQLTIRIEKGGAGLIEVMDNGGGIHPDDLALAVLRHGTSKIHESADLVAINSLGFRGEALASICAVSRLQICSCLSGAKHAWQLTAEGTKTQKHTKPVAHPVGTTVSVRDLFFNTPARRKFLRTEKTEFAHIEEVVKRIALYHTQVRIQFFHNGRMVYDLAAANTEAMQTQRLKQLCGQGFVEHALHLNMEATGLQLSGWIALPQYTRAQADLQYMYVNGRMVRDKLLNHAVRQAYAGQLPSDRYPAYVLALGCCPSHVDVNVHPTKHEVRFYQSRLIHDFIYSRLGEALQQTLVPVPSSPITTAVTESTISTPRYPQATMDSRPSISQSQAKANPVAAADYQALWPDKVAEVPQGCFGKPLAALKQQFILAEAEEGLWIIHVQRARQQLLAYQFSQGLAQQAIVSQPLLFPLTFTLPKTVDGQLTPQLEALNKLGFLLEPMGEGQWVLRQAPKLLQGVDFNGFMPAFVSECRSDEPFDTLLLRLTRLAPRYIEQLLTMAVMEKLLMALGKIKADLVEPLPYKKFTLAELTHGSH